MIFPVYVLFAAVDCKKPWHYLACTLYLKKPENKQVRLSLAEQDQTLQFTEQAYNNKFGREIGVDLFYALKRILERFPSITSDQVKTKICLKIWKVFSEKWVEVFKCTRDCRQVTIEQGESFMFSSFFVQKASALALFVHQSTRWSFGMILK